MKTINNEIIKTAVDQMFQDKILGFNEIDVYRATAGIPKEGLKSLTLADHLILEWIRQIVNKQDQSSTPESKIKIIKAIFNSMDKYMGGIIDE